MGAGRLLDAGRIPELPLYLDSPMAKSASDIYRAHPEAYDEETAALLRAHEAPLDYPASTSCRTSRSRSGSRGTAPPYIDRGVERDAHRGTVGGPRRAAADDPSATILFVGYQGEGSLGGHLVRGGTESAGSTVVRCRVRATIRSLDGFSAHADEPELLDWLGGFIHGRRAGDPGVPRASTSSTATRPPSRRWRRRSPRSGLALEIPAWHQTVSLD